MTHQNVAVLVLIALLVHGTETMTVDLYAIVSDGDACPRLEERADAIQKIRDSVKALLNVSNARSEETQAQCGDGLWYRVANLNMTNASQQCPSAWREYNTDGIRACGRPVTSSRSCPATTYSTGHPYRKVCGRVIGYQVGTPDAFNTEVSSTSINRFYADGISITHGSPRKHIWTYAGGVSDTDSRSITSFCPCQTSRAVQPPSFLGNNYYCETGNPNRDWLDGQIFAADKLWDGEQCENEGSCCTTKSPPWFSVELSISTTVTDDIEVRICGDESTSNEDTPIELLEIYVQ